MEVVLFKHWNSPTKEHSGEDYPNHWKNYLNQGAITDLTL